MATELWTEKYRPATLDGYVLQDPKLKDRINQWVEEGTIPHLFFHGGPGTGKTTLAKIVLNLLGTDPCNVKEINASLNNGVQYIRDTVEGFASSMPFMADYSYILLDEADFISPEAQATLRSLMERYAGQCRFILTGNYPHRIIPALRSRLQEFEIRKPDVEQFQERAVSVLIAEGVSIDDADVLGDYIAATYPDLRKCLNTLQQNTINNVLVSATAAASADDDWRVLAVAYFREKQFVEGRKVICKSAQPGDYDEIWTFLYQNTDWWTEGDLEKERHAIVAIRNGMAKAPLCADQELNLSATLCELELVASAS